MTTDAGGPGGGGAVRHEVEGPKVTDALYQAFPNTPTLMGTDPADGMPRPAMSQAWVDAQAPELDPAHFVCMADCSKFVMRDSAGNVTREIAPDKVERTPDGSWRTKLDAPVARTLAERTGVFGGIAAAAVALLAVYWLHVFFHLGQFSTVGIGAIALAAVLAKSVQLSPDTNAAPAPAWIPVEPIRPQCTHYARQLVPFPEDKEHRLVARLCTARRTDEGEFLDLGNAKMFACELRTPSIGNEQELLDQFDERVIASQKKQTVEDDFDVDAALGTQTTKGT